jgi:hypothetical protein
VTLMKSRNPTAILLLLCAVVCLPQTPQSHTPLDNQRVSALSRSDLSTDELVRIIMTAPEVNFELSPGSTDALTKAGVKDEVIRAMAARNGKAYTPAAAQAPVPLVGAVAANPTTPPAARVFSADIPSEPGLYTVTEHGPSRIEGQVISFERTGSLLVSGVTAGIKSRKINVQLPGAHSANVFSKSTEFFYRMSTEMI